MKDKELEKLEQHDENCQTANEAEEKQGVAKKASLAIFILVLLLFVAVMFISYFFEAKFGKTAGTAALIVVALLIAVYLYRKEIMGKLKRKK